MTPKVISLGLDMSSTDGERLDRLDVHLYCLQPSDLKGAGSYYLLLFTVKMNVSYEWLELIP